MNYLDQKINQHFGGLVVRKDLVRAVRGNAVVPTYVLEYLLGQNCATADEESLKTAKEIDSIAEQLDKVAKTIESDSDEKYMKEYFKGGDRQSDSDEKFMKEFDTDISDESQKGLPAKGNVEVPYQKI